MNWGLLGGIYAMFHATHGIADYWLQTDWQAQNKSKNWEALFRHCFFYGASFAWVGILLVNFQLIPIWKSVALPWIIAIPHAWMDRRRFLMWFCAKTKGWTEQDLGKMVSDGKSSDVIAKVAAIRTHVAIHLDQKFHYLCLMITAMWLAA